MNALIYIVHKHEKKLFNLNIWGYHHTILDVTISNFSN